MYRDAYQRGLLTVFYSSGSKPLLNWDTVTRNGYIKIFLDEEIKNMVTEVRGANISTSYIICPKGNQVLGITMPFLVMIVKNLMKYFSFEVTVLDDTRTRRRFRVSNFQSTTQILPLCTVMPLCLAPGWNQIQFNLGEFTRRAYKKQFVEVQKLKINANIRLRRIYFADRIMPEDELPKEYKLYFPLQPKGRKDAKKITEEVATEEQTKPSKMAIESLSTVAKRSSKALPAKGSLENLKLDEQAQEDVKGAEPADSGEKEDIDKQTSLTNVEKRSSMVLSEKGSQVNIESDQPAQDEDEDVKPEETTAEEKEDIDVVTSTTNVEKLSSMALPEEGSQVNIKSDEPAQEGVETEKSAEAIGAEKEASGERPVEEADAETKGEEQPGEQKEPSLEKQPSEVKEAGEEEKPA